MACHCCHLQWRDPAPRCCVLCVPAATVSPGSLPLPCSPHESQVLARAVKEHERRDGRREGFADTPGDVLAYKYFRDVSGGSGGLRQQGQGVAVPEGAWWSANVALSSGSVALSSGSVAPRPAQPNQYLSQAGIVCYQNVGLSGIVFRAAACRLPAPLLAGPGVPAEGRCGGVRPQGAGGGGERGGARQAGELAWWGNGRGIGGGYACKQERHFPGVARSLEDRQWRRHRLQVVAGGSGAPAQLELACISPAHLRLPSVHPRARCWRATSSRTCRCPPLC